MRGDTSPQSVHWQETLFTYGRFSGDMSWSHSHENNRGVVSTASYMEDPGFETSHKFGYPNHA